MPIITAAELDRMAQEGGWWQSKQASGLTMPPPPGRRFGPGGGICSMSPPSDGIYDGDDDATDIDNDRNRSGRNPIIKTSKYGSGGNEALTAGVHDHLEKDPWGVGPLPNIAFPEWPLSKEAICTAFGDAPLVSTGRHAASTKTFTPQLQPSSTSKLYKIEGKRQLPGRYPSPSPSPSPSPTPEYRLDSNPTPGLQQRPRSIPSKNPFDLLELASYNAIPTGKEQRKQPKKDVQKEPQNVPNETLKTSKNPYDLISGDNNPMEDEQNRFPQKQSINETNQQPDTNWGRTMLPLELLDQKYASHMQREGTQDDKPRAEVKQLQNSVRAQQAILKDHQPQINGPTQQETIGASEKVREEEDLRREQVRRLLAEQQRKQHSKKKEQERQLRKAREQELQRQKAKEEEIQRQKDRQEKEQKNLKTKEKFPAGADAAVKNDTTIAVGLQNSASSSVHNGEQRIQKEQKPKQRATVAHNPTLTTTIGTPVGAVVKNIPSAEILQISTHEGGQICERYEKHTNSLLRRKSASKPPATLAKNRPSPNPKFTFEKEVALHQKMEPPSKTTADEPVVLSTVKPLKIRNVAQYSLHRISLGDVNIAELVKASMTSATSQKPDSSKRCQSAEQSDAETTPRVPDNSPAQSPPKSTPLLLKRKMFDKAYKELKKEQDLLPRLPVPRDLSKHQQEQLKVMKQLRETLDIEKGTQSVKNSIATGEKDEDIKSRRRILDMDDYRACKNEDEDAKETYIKPPPKDVVSVEVPKGKVAKIVDAIKKSASRKINPVTDVEKGNNSSNLKRRVDSPKPAQPSPLVAKNAAAAGKNILSETPSEKTAVDSTLQKRVQKMKESSYVTIKPEWKDVSEDGEGDDGEFEEVDISEGEKELADWDVVDEDVEEEWEDGKVSLDTLENVSYW